MSDELRQDIAGAIYDATGLRGEAWATASDVADEYVLADAVLAVVQPLVDERDRLKDEAVHYIAQRLALDEVAKHADALRVERDRLLWLHAEAVWQREQLRIEADHQWTVRRQMGHRMIDLDSELTEAVDLARWLLAESAWRLAKSEGSRFPADWRQQIGLCESSGAAVDLMESWGETAAEPDGAAQIVAERRRVVTAKGYDAAHDDQHVHGELLDAARCYANQGRTSFQPFTYKYGTAAGALLDQDWPWWTDDKPAGWKPSSDPVRNLVKAGQFIAAEIDRLKRASRRQSEHYLELHEGGRVSAHRLDRVRSVVVGTLMPYSESEGERVRDDVGVVWHVDASSVRPVQGDLS